jgi:MOSC domain-containing protein
MWIDAIWRYPGKSMAGERLDSAELGELGVAGDRLAYVIDERGETISARTRPRLLGLAGAIDDDGEPTVDGHRWDAAGAAELVRQAAGPGARLIRARSSERFDILPLLVATDGAVREAGYDLRRFRPNIVIGGVEGLAERQWERRFLRAGEAVIGLATLRERCIVTTFDPDTGEQDVDVLRSINQRFDGTLALNAWVAQAGRVSVGDTVEILDSFAGAPKPLFGRFVQPRSR